VRIGSVRFKNRSRTSSGQIGLSKKHLASAWKHRPAVPEKKDEALSHADSAGTPARVEPPPRRACESVPIQQVVGQMDELRLQSPSGFGKSS
jgi:hypothetical protein